MENQIETPEEVEDSKLFTKIDPNLKDRCMVYLTESRLNRDEIDSMRDLVEAALHEYMLNHPITTKS